MNLDQRIKNLKDLIKKDLDNDQLHLASKNLKKLEVISRRKKLEDSLRDKVQKQLKEEKESSLKKMAEEENFKRKLSF